MGGYRNSTADSVKLNTKATAPRAMTASALIYDDATAYTSNPNWIIFAVDRATVY